MGITNDHYQKLGAPFAPTQVKFRAAFNKPNQDGRVECLAFVDGRTVMDRIEEVDADWACTYSPPQIKQLPKDQWDNERIRVSVDCVLTIGGVTRVDVGEAVGRADDDKLVKTAYSDALKRAAVRFRIGRHLYDLPKMYADRGGYWTKQNGNVGGITRQGEEALRSEYQRSVSGEAPPPAPAAPARPAESTPAPASGSVAANDTGDADRDPWVATILGLHRHAPVLDKNGNPTLEKWVEKNVRGFADQAEFERRSFRFTAALAEKHNITQKKQINTLHELVKKCEPAEQIIALAASLATPASGFDQLQATLDADEVPF